MYKCRWIRRTTIRSNRENKTTHARKVPFHQGLEYVQKGVFLVLVVFNVFPLTPLRPPSCLMSPRELFHWPLYSGLPLSAPLLLPLDAPLRPRVGNHHVCHNICIDGVGPFPIASACGCHAGGLSLRWALSVSLLLTGLSCCMLFACSPAP